MFFQLPPEAASNLRLRAEISWADFETFKNKRTFQTFEN
jgi:hypothetical protein